ncbi:MAG: acyl transferase [Bacteroidota bacterium]
MMRQRDSLAEKIKKVDELEFEQLALDVFNYQARCNPIYAEFLQLLRVGPESVSQIADIPALPIACFKQHILRTGSWPSVQVFTSSGTSQTQTSQHWLRSDPWYKHHARRAFEQQYGPLESFVVLALLPAYLERQGSSLVFMVNDFIQVSGRAESGFYLYDQEELIKKLQLLEAQNQKFLLLGVSFALLDLAEALASDTIRIPEGSIIMETGGMKGRRRELTRAELHRQISQGFKLEGSDTDQPGAGEKPIDIHSEYGMTELLSQAYAPKAGRFSCAPSLRVMCRDLTDPFCIRTDGKTGAINCIDLANLDTISFIATDDLGKVYPDGSFEVLGRMDYSDTRGCNLLYAQA